MGSKTLFFNAKIWTSASQTRSWMVVDSQIGKIMQCGFADDQPPKDEPITKVDMKQQWIFPGFHDSHMHIELFGLALDKGHLKLPSTVKELQNRLACKINDLPTESDWFVGFGWDHDLMDRMPTCEDLDKVSKGHPVVLHRVCLHILVANSKALELAHISDKSPDPENGVIDRFPANHPKAGHPTGVLREDGGVHLMAKVIPSITSEQKKSNIKAALNECVKVGLTSVHTVDQCSWNEYVELAKDNQLPIHCYFSAWYVDIDTDNFPSKPDESYNNLSCDCVKIFLDGALNTQTAALTQPYVGSDSNCGVMLLTDTEIELAFNKVTKAGFRMEIHVIGDRAAEVALNYLEKCKVPSENRTIFVHCQILRSELLNRMLKNGVVPTLQPSFVPTDSKQIRNRLPESLQQCIYPWRTLIKKGIPCGGSSDAPVETINPLQGIYDAIFRPDLMFNDGRPFIEKECLTFEEAINLYTIGSAFADKAEKYKGKIKAGFQADFVVLNVPLDKSGKPRNLIKNPELIKTCSIKQVWVKGKCLWEN